ncbi:MAG: hypothetical protein ACRDL7_00285 [Gaiellaceae bacterium]
MKHQRSRQKGESDYSTNYRFKKMDSELTAFRNALGRIGFTEPVKDAIVNQGFRTIGDLNVLGKDDIKRVCKIIRDKDDELSLPFMQQQLFEAMRYWVKTRKRRGKDVEATMFTRSVAEEYAQIMLVDAEDAGDKADGTKLMPEKFKFGTNWNVFKEAVDTYLSQIKGGDRIPLNYIIRDDAVPGNDAVYSNDMEELINTVPLRGEHYKRDNDKVYGVLKSLVLEGPGWNWIIHLDRSRDGRKAWQALRSHYEGDSNVNRNKDEAYASITRATYQGERKNFTFETYTNIHQRAHQDLQRLGEPVPEMKKVRDFLLHIHDPQLVAGKSTVLATPTMLENFTEASNFLSNFVVRSKTMSGTERQVSGVEAGRGRTNRSRGGRGRGRGRSARGGRSGRNNNGSNNDVDRYHSPEEWGKLSAGQRAKILQARESKKRNASAITKSEEVTTSADESKTDSNNAGDQFGRHAHQS